MNSTSPQEDKQMEVTAALRLGSSRDQQLREEHNASMASTSFAMPCSLASGEGPDAEGEALGFAAATSAAQT